MRISKTLPIAALTIATLALAACSDSTSSPVAPDAASALRPQGPRLTVATSSVTTAWLYPTYDNVYVSAEGHRLTIPANAICQVGTSGYGPSTWDLPCATATQPILFTITSTTDASGNSKITVQPDVRFSPSKTVTASFANQAAANAFNALIKYCPTLGSCIDESLTDASLKTYTDPASGRVFRRIKHFSGYTVIVGADGGEWSLDRAAAAARASGYITTTGVDATEPAAASGNDRNR